MPSQVPGSAAPAATAVPTRWLAVVAAIAAGVVAAFHVGKLPSALPGLRADLGLSLVAAGWAASTFNTIGTFCALPLGIVATRINHLALVGAGLVLLAAGGVLGAIAPGAAMLLASRTIEGGGFLAIAIGAPALIVGAAAAADRGLALGLWSTYMPVGVALMLAATPVALATIGWRGLWLVNAAIALTLVGLLFHLRREYRSGVGDVAVELSGAGATLVRPGLWLLASAFGLYTAQWVTLMTWLPTFLADDRGLSLSQAALATAAVVACNIPGNLLGTWWLRRGARFGVVIAVAAAVMGASAVPIFSDSIPTAARAVAYAAFSLAGGMLPAAVLSGAPRFAAHHGHVALTAGVVMQGSNLGQFVGPPVVAAMVASSQSWNSAVPFLVGCAIACVTVGLLLTRSRGLKRGGALPR